MNLFGWSNQIVGDMDPEFANDDPVTASAELSKYGIQLAEERADDPGEDLVAQLVRADVDGAKLSKMAFTEFPGQWELFKKQRPGTAAGEIVRWTTPITSFQRTALEDAESSGVMIAKGHRVVMLYRWANFDEDVFDDPYTFDILRNPNPQVAFGGTGAHYCLGANLAKMTIDLVFNAIADEIPDLTTPSTPERLCSGWLNGVKHWQVDYTRQTKEA